MCDEDAPSLYPTFEKEFHYSRLGDELREAEAVLRQRLEEEEAEKWAGWEEGGDEAKGEWAWNPDWEWGGLILEGK
jgi:hypothetical protein